jgi:VWFA-related protein
MSKLALCVIAAVLVSFLSKTAQCQQPASPVFTSGTDFVEVPVLVQRSGKHVAGLKKEDFILHQDGKEQPVAFFEEVHLAPAEPGSAKSGQSDSVPTGQMPPQMTIIALDMVNTPNLDRAYFTEEFQRYLSKTGKFNTPIALVAIERSGIHILREFTTDARLLLSAVAKDSTKQPTANNDGTAMVRQLSDEALSSAENYGVTEAVSVADALRLRSADEGMVRFQDRSSRLDTEYAIQQLAQALKGIPGRKSLLLVGSGFKFIDSKIVLKSISRGLGGIDLEYSQENSGQALNQTAYTWKLLNDANVAVYPIDTRRTVNTAFQTMDTSGANTPSSLSYEQNRQADRDILDTFKTIAAATGGKACFYRTDLDNCVREAVEDDRDYYLLGFYADKKNRQPGWHKIEVKLNEKASLRYREGFIIAKFNPEAVRRTDISLAVSSPFAYTALPFSGKFDSFTEGNGKKLAKFSLFIPPNGITPEESSGHIDFDVVAIARGDGGKEAARFTQHINRNYSAQNIAEIKRIGIDYSNRLELASGEYGVWFVVRDNISGRTGSAVVRLKVP